MFAQTRPGILAAPEKGAQWVTVETCAHTHAYAPSGLDTRRRLLCALLRSIPGSRYAQLHFRVTLVNTTNRPALFAPEETVTVYHYALQVTDTMHRILSAIPGARIQPEVRPM